MNMKELTNFQITVNDQVALVDMCRPAEFNSMTRLWWRELKYVFGELSASASVRVIVLASQGKHFSSGMDLQNFASGQITEDGTSDPARNAEATRRTAIHLQGCISALEEARQPVIAVIQGACIGGGVDLITAADIRICTDKSYFVVQETNIGILADVGTTQRLPTLIPLGICRELVYTGDKLTAQRAEHLGLANAVLPTQQEALDYAMAMAKKIASKSPLVLTGAKRVINHSRDNSVAAGLEYVALWNAAMLSADDLGGSMKAYMNKETPVYDDILDQKIF